MFPDFMATLYMLQIVRRPRYKRLQKQLKRIKYLHRHHDVLAEVFTTCYKCYVGLIENYSGNSQRELRNISHRHHMFLP
jgi:hypothetical protein